jgi:hypothetical protein
MKESEPKPSVSEEQKKLARQTNLAEYLISIGEPLVDTQGGRYRHKNHDSLVFTENAYYWNSQNESGNAIDYLVRHKGMDFISAVLELINASPPDERVNEQKRHEQFMFTNIEFSPDMRHSIAYLVKTRRINYDLIKKLIVSNLLYEELQHHSDPATKKDYQAHNIVFPMYDEENQIVGAETQGTLTDKRFKGLKNGSKYGYGYNINPCNSDTVRFILFFESAIDLLSFWDIKNSENKILNDCLLISMAGLKENIVNHTLNAAKQPVQPFLCVDNDTAGANFIKAVTGQIEDIKPYLPNPEYKDWNEQLKASKKI